MAIEGELKAGLSPDELRQFLLAQWSEAPRGTVIDRLRGLAPWKTER